MNFEIHSRRQLLQGSLGLLGSLALSRLSHGEGEPAKNALSHFKPRAKRVIYLFQSGAPSQMDLFDYKPGLADLRGTEVPDSIRPRQRLTGMTATQTSFPAAPSKFRFAQHGKCGAWISEVLP